MADIAPYAVVVVTALVSGLGGYLSGWWRTRSSARTAARLVHAELLQNAASVLYYRRSRRLVAPSVRRTAWDANSDALARLREPGAFSAISQSYQALEGITYIAKAGSDGVPDELRPLLEQAIAQLAAGVRVCGRQAGLDDQVIEDEARALGPQVSGVPEAAGSQWDQVPLAVFVIPAIVEDRLLRGPAAAGSTSVTATVETLGAHLPPPAAHHAWPDRMLRGTPRRLIFDAEHSELGSIALSPARREGDPDTGDPAVDEAYDALGVIHDFFYGEYALDSYDGRGAELQGVVHYGKNYLNGFWDGARIYYGDGDDVTFRRFTYALDMSAHEFAMGAIHDIRPLVYANQSGALLVSVADVLAVLVKQYRRQETTDQADWLLGDQLVVPRPGVRGLRSLKDPGTAFDSDVLGKDVQPSHMRHFAREAGDAGGVHLNSGIPNRAFWLVASALGGNAWEAPGHIWFRALQDPKLTARSGFRAFAAATVRASGEHAAAVTDAWRQVGVRPGAQER